MFKEYEYFFALLLFWGHTWEIRQDRTIWTRVSSYYYIWDLGRRVGPPFFILTYLIGVLNFIFNIFHQNTLQGAGERALHTGVHTLYIGDEDLILGTT